MEQDWAHLASLSSPLALFSLNLLLLPELVSKLHLEVQDSRAIHLREVVKVKNEDLVD